MPIYAYKCESCGHAKDVLQKMSDTPLTDCPACSASMFKKQLTAAGFQLKGSGWYATDFKGGGNAGAPVSDKSEAGSSTAGASGTGESKASESKTESKSDAKPAAPAPSKPSDGASGKSPAA